MEQLIKIHPADNVAVAISALKQGETVVVSGKSIVVQNDIPAGHKMAIVPIAMDEDVIKYGFPIGQAKRNVQPGEWLHTHNVKSKLGDLLEYRYEPQKAPAWQPAEDHVHTFQAMNAVMAASGSAMKYGSSRRSAVSMLSHGKSRNRRRHLWIRI